MTSASSTGVCFIERKRIANQLIMEIKKLGLKLCVDCKHCRRSPLDTYTCCLHHRALSVNEAFSPTKCETWNKEKTVKFIIVRKETNN